MRLSICAVGRLKAGPEKVLFDDYLTRLDRTGRALSLGPTAMIEVEDRKGGGMAAEAMLLRNAVPDGAQIVTMDERGRQMSSPEFAKFLTRIRDDGARDCAFVIGGADGIAKDLRAEASYSISFGKMVWPHMLVRVMLAEQLYRAASILAGSPYHRA